MALIFFDDFDYDIGREDTDADDQFVSQGGWTVCKTEQAGEPGANLYLYTVDAIPGYGGAFPGGGSRVLCQEGVVGSQSGQSDGYLQYGASVDNTIPANAWFQYWVYHQNHAGSGQESLWVSRSKWIYLTNETGGAYPSHSHRWMMSCTSISSAPLYVLGGNNTPSAQPYLTVASSAGISTIAWTGEGYIEGDNDTLGFQNQDELLVNNRWTLVKFNVDTSTNTPRFRMWLRALGTAAFTQVADWQHGVNGLSWTMTSTGGHKAFRWPSTIGNTDPPWEDTWAYFADFAIADAEADLPTYADGDPTPGGHPMLLAGVL